MSVRLTFPRLLMLVAVLAVSACSKHKENDYKEQSVYEIYSQALSYLEKGRYKDAIALFRKLSTAKTFDTFLTLSAYRKIV